MPSFDQKDTVTRQKGSLGHRKIGFGGAVGANHYLIWISSQHRTQNRFVYFAKFFAIHADNRLWFVAHRSLSRSGAEGESTP